MRKLWIWLPLNIAALLFLIGGLLAWLLATESGLKFALTQAKNQLPDALQVKAAQGSLLGGMTLQGVRWQQDGMSVTADEIALEIRPWALFTGTAHLDHLRVQTLAITIPPSQDEKPETETQSGPLNLPDIALPIQVRVDELSLKAVSFNQADQQYRLDELYLALGATDHLQIDRFFIQLPQQDPLPPLRMNLSGTLGFTAPHPVALSLGWASHVDPVGDLSGQLDVTGTTEQLVIKHNLQPFDLQLAAQLNKPLTELGWQAELGLPQFTWPLPPSEEAPQLIQLQRTQLKAQGNLKQFSGTLSLQAQGKDVPESEWRLAITGNPEQIHVQELWGKLLGGELRAEGNIELKPELKGDLTLDSTGIQLTRYWADWPSDMGIRQHLRADFTQKHLHIRNWNIDLPPEFTRLTAKGDVALTPEGAHDIELEWTQLQWPLSGPQLAGSPQGKFTLQGPVSAYSLGLDAAVQARNAPDVDLHLQGEGNLDKLASLNLVANTLGGQIRIEGTTGWKPQVSWQLAISADQIQPAEQWPDVEGTLSSRLTTEGTISEQIQAVLKLADLSGQLRGYPLKASGELGMAGEEYRIDHLNLESGKTRITAHGQYGSQTSLKAEIRAPDLSGLLPQAKGALSADLNVSGPPTQPKVDLKLQAQHLGMSPWEVDQIHGLVALNLATDQLQTQLDLSGVSQAGEPRVNSLSLSNTGKISDHRIRLALQTPNEQLTTTLAGGYDQKLARWQGFIQDLALKTEQFGQWLQSQPTPLALASGSLTLGELCLKESTWETKLCTQATQDATGIQTRGEIHSLPIGQAAAPWLPQGVRLEGTGLNADWQVQLNPDQTLLTETRIQISEGQLEAQVEGKKHRFKHGGGSTQVSLTPSGLSASTRFALLEDSLLSATANLPGFQPLKMQEHQPVEAQITTRLADLGILPTLVPVLEKSAGAIQGNIRVTGELNAPKLVADMKLQDGLLAIPSAGLVLENIQASLEADESGKASTTLSLKSGEGWLKVDTWSQLTDAENWQSQLRIEGKDLLAVNVPDIKAQVSPDITLELTPQGAKVYGLVEIPSADITPNIVVGESKGGGSAVKSSGDVVLTDNQASSDQPDSAPKAPPFAVEGGLGVRLGEQIKLAVVGFSSRVEGGIKVALHPDYPVPKAMGEIRIVDGHYRSYGQDLTIDKGRILFLGGPADNPGLDIKAYRAIHDQPSEYLAAGKISKAGVHIQGRAKEPRIKLYSEPMTDDKNILSYIVTGSGLGGDIRKELSLGTYLKPDLYVSIGYDLFANEKAFNLRYEINKRLGVEGVAGDRDSGVDFSYRLSR